jgi:hypothetical protein
LRWTATNVSKPNRLANVIAFFLDRGADGLRVWSALNTNPCFLQVDSDADDAWQVRHRLGYSASAMPARHSTHGYFKHMSAIVPP